MPDPTRGVLYITWGTKSDRVLPRAMESLRAVHPELPIHVEKLPETATLLDKARMFDLSPFEQTLYLDADSVVLGRLDFGFEQAIRYGWACSLCVNPWARRYTGLAGAGDMVEYNSGVMFFTRKAEPLFRAWQALAPKVDSSIKYLRDGRVLVMSVNDQGSLAKAVDQTGLLPFALPPNWNFQPKWHKSFFGPIKIWHNYGDVPPIVRHWNQQQTRPGALIGYAVPPPAENSSPD
jgi:hypothetical protein